jgi:hypothetical protein
MFRKTCSSEFHGSYAHRLLQAQGEGANGEFFYILHKNQRDWKRSSGQIALVLPK